VDHRDAVAPEENERVLAANLLLLDGAHRALQALRAVGIRAAAEKGAALLLSVYTGEEDSRAMDDVDLVVEPGALPRAISVLERRLGLRRIPDSGFELGTPSGAPGHGVLRIDLHDRLHHGGARSAREALARAASVSWGDRRVEILEPTDHLLEIVAHAVLHHGRLREKEAEDLRRLAALVNGRELRRRAARAGLLVPLSVALERAQGARIAPEVDRLLRALPPLGASASLMAHLLRRRLTSHAPPGRFHLIVSPCYRPPAEALGHLARRAWLGPDVALQREAGLRPPARPAGG